MKKLLILCLLLWGCQKPHYQLTVYYSPTCPSCFAFITQVIPVLEDEYGQNMTINELSIDDESSIESYKETIGLLKDYPDEDTGSVPMIVLEGYFVKIGYETSQKEYMIQAIKNAIEGKELPLELEVYYFK